MDTIEVLRHTDLFYNLTSEQLQLIANIVRQRRVFKGEIIFEEGSNSREVYVVVSGSVVVTHQRSHSALASGETQQVRLATLSSGQSFGEIAFVDQALREATVSCDSDEANLLVINPDELMAQCEANPALGFFIIRNIAKDLALIIRELDLHILGGIYWQMPLENDSTTGQGQA